MVADKRLFWTVFPLEPQPFTDPVAEHAVASCRHVKRRVLKVPDQEPRVAASAGEA